MAITVIIPIIVIMYQLSTPHISTVVKHRVRGADVFLGGHPAKYSRHTLLL